MGLDLTYIGGQTPLDEDEKDGLLIPAIATREELDEFEQQNIEDAIVWLLSRSLKAETILTLQFVRSLHRRMFGNVWAWAGDFRTSNKNFGVDKYQISTELKSLIDDTLYWIKCESFEPDEIAVRFKHRIVSIHCFPNGNGRHSRLIADAIVNEIFQLPVFTWGRANLVIHGDVRRKYIAALQQADGNNYEPLLAFARS
jgi:Fic-DOC domain mobile mystery protein B